MNTGYLLVLVMATAFPADVFKFKSLKTCCPTSFCGNEDPATWPHGQGRFTMNDSLYIIPDLYSHNEMATADGGTTNDDRPIGLFF